MCCKPSQVNNTSIPRNRYDIRNSFLAVLLSTPCANLVELKSFSGRVAPNRRWGIAMLASEDESVTITFLILTLLNFKPVSETGKRLFINLNTWPSTYLDSRDEIRSELRPQKNSTDIKSTDIAGNQYIEQRSRLKQTESLTCQ